MSLIYVLISSYVCYKSTLFILRLWKDNKINNYLLGLMLLVIVICHSYVCYNYVW